MDTPEVQNRCFEYRKRNISEVYGVLKIRSNLGTMWMPKTSMLLPKIHPKSDLRRLQEGNRISIDFLKHSRSLWVAKMWPCWPHVDGQNAIRFDKDRCPKPRRKNGRKRIKKSALSQAPGTNQQSKNYIRATQPTKPANQSINQPTDFIMVARRASSARGACRTPRPPCFSHGRAGHKIRTKAMSRQKCRERRNN